MHRAVVFLWLATVCVCSLPLQRRGVPALPGVPPSLIKPSCETSLDVLTFIVKCGDIVTNTLLPLEEEVEQAIDVQCNTTEIANSTAASSACASKAFSSVFANSPKIFQDTSAMVQEMCADQGHGYVCWDEMIALVGKCVDFEKANITSIGGLDVQQALQLASFVCEASSSGYSCALQANEVLSTLNVPGTGSEQLPCESGACTSECRSLLQAIHDNMGCCWSELKSEVGALAMKTNSTAEEILAVPAAAWAQCNIPEPTQACTGTLQPPSTSAQTPSSKTSTSAPSGQSGGSGGQPGQPDLPHETGKAPDHGALARYLVVGTICGAIGLTVLGLMAVSYYRKHYAGRRYLSINSDDVMTGVNQLHGLDDAWDDEEEEDGYA